MNNLLIKREGVMTRLIFLLMFSIIFFLILPSYSASQEKKTFGEIKKELFEKQVYIYGSKYDNPLLRGKETLMEWEIVTKQGDEKSGYSYKSEPLNFAPYSLKGSKGIVESILINESSLNKRKETSAFGEKITDADAVNPYFSLVVRLNDGTLVSCTGFYSTMIGDKLKLASKVDSGNDEIDKNINSIIGKVIYPMASAKIFPPKTDLDTIVEIDPSRRRVDVLGDYELLTPLKIIRAKYLEAEDAIIFELNYDNGKTAIALVKKPHFRDKEKLNPKNYWDNLILKGGFLDKFLSGSGFTTKIPDYLTKKEIEAIKKRSIFKGMSTGALALSWGYEDKSNNWGSGGYQYIYGGKQFVYIKNGKIVDWQSLK